MKVADAKAIENAMSIVPRASTKLKFAENRKKLEEEKENISKAYQRFRSLTNGLKLYRTRLMNDSERKEFDSKSSLIPSSLSLEINSSFFLSC